MILIKQPSDLSQIDPFDPVYPYMRKLVEDLIIGFTEVGAIYDWEADGFLVLVEESDTDGPLIGIWDDWTLLDIPWEGVIQEKGFFKAIFLANNEFGIVFLIPDAEWVNGKLREILELNLDP